MLAASRVWQIDRIIVLELFELDVFPADVAGFSAVDLESDKAFAGVVFFVGVFEVGAFFAVEPCLDVVALAADFDGIPFVPFEEFLSLGGEFLAVFLVGFFGEKPAAA